MRRQYSTLKTVGAMLILFSCSSPKYTYNFDHYDYNSGRKTLPNNDLNESFTATDAELLKIDKSELVTAANNGVVTPSERTTTDAKVVSTTTAPIKAISRTEKKQLRSELRDYVKNHTKERKGTDETASVDATKQLDDDLKLAIIFGAIGITFAILGGINTVFWVIGVIGLIVGLVFFIRWISTQ